MSGQHPIEKVKADVKAIKTQLSLLQGEYSTRLTALEEAVRGLEREERAPSPPPPHPVEVSLELRTLQQECQRERDLRTSLEEQLRSLQDQLQKLRVGAGTVAVASRIKKSEGVDKKDSDGRTQLHRAAMDGDLEEVSRLLWMKGADATLRDIRGDTPLHLAASNGHVLVCASLLASEGIEVNAKANDLSTPLHCASYRGRVEVAKVLLERGADATLKNKEGSSPLYVALNEEMRRLLR